MILLIILIFHKVLSVTRVLLYDQALFSIKLLSNQGQDIIKHIIITKAHEWLT